MQEELKKREEEIKKEMWTKAVTAAKAQSEEENKKREVELESLRKRDEEGRKKEIEFLRERQEFENKMKNVEFEKEKALFEAKKQMEEEIKTQVQKEQTLGQEKLQLEWEKKLAERDKQMEILQRSLAEANQKANQGSIQIQGEIQENALKSLLENEFPFDTVDDVPTGIKGADLVHSVRNQFGHTAGIIAWESKNTKAWSDSWVDKLKEELQKITGREVVIKIKEITKPELHAQLVAENVAEQLEKRVTFRRAMKKALDASVDAGAKGVKMQVAGRLGGAEIARTEKMSSGSVPLHTLRADVDYGFAEAKTAYGVIGVKVWIYKGLISSGKEKLYAPDAEEGKVQEVATAKN